MPRELTSIVKAAVATLFGDRASCIEAKLCRASAFERAHQDILAFSLGDEAKLEALCDQCEDDDRNVYVMEERPEEYFVSVRASASLTRRNHDVSDGSLIEQGHKGDDSD